jgi:hypothetical protein
MNGITANTNVVSLIAVYLNSPGGTLYEGMRLGRMFKDERIKTVVEGGEMCASACAIAFLGGRDRQGVKWMSSTTTSRWASMHFAMATAPRRVRQMIRKE